MQCITHTYYSHSSPLDHLSSMELRPLIGKYWAAATLLLLAAALMLSTSCFASSIAKPSPPAATATTNFSDHSVLLTLRSLIPLERSPHGATSRSISVDGKVWRAGSMAIVVVALWVSTSAPSVWSVPSLLPSPTSRTSEGSTCQ